MRKLLFLYIFSVIVWGCKKSSTTKDNSSDSNNPISSTAGEPEAVSIYLVAGDYEFPIVLDGGDLGEVTLESAEISYSFPNKIIRGEDFEVTIISQPNAIDCEILGTPSLAMSAPASISIGLSCEANTFAGLFHYPSSWFVFFSGYSGLSIEPFDNGVEGQGVYSISPDLPSGLSFSTTTGKIDGTPTGTSPETTYIVSRLIAGVTSTQSVKISVMDGFVVDSTEDIADDASNGTCFATGATGPTKCTLRAAIAEAGSSGNKAVLFEGSYILTSQININGDVTLIGTGEGTSVIDGNLTTRMIHLNGLHTLRLQNLGFINASIPGAATDYGGAVRITGTDAANLATLKASHVSWRNGQCGQAKDGCAVYANFADFDIEYAIVEDNTASHSDGWDAGFWFDNAVGTVDQSSFKNNHVLLNALGTSGAISISGADSNINISNSSFVGNSSSHMGAAIHISTNATVSIENTTFHNNIAAHAGAAIIVQTSSNLTVKNCVFSGSETTTGNGSALAVWSNSTANVYNSIFFNNIRNGSVVDHCTVDTGAGAVLHMENNLLDIADADFCTLATDSANVVNANLGLDNFGSPFSYVEHFSVKAGSPAVNTGLNSQCTSKDIRGFARMADGTDQCDIGTSEFQ